MRAGLYVPCAAAPAYLLIDVSAASVNSGMLACLAQTVRETLNSLPGDERTIGVCDL